MTLAIDAGQILCRSFKLSLLLSGNAARAEAAVMAAVNAIEATDNWGEQLLRGAIVAAVQNNCSKAFAGSELDGALPGIPDELGSVLCLPAELRHCFVLRILASLSRNDCVHLLKMSARKMDERTSAAVRRLASQPDEHCE